ncbi:MAG: N-6 DNA methylase [Sulfolobales archaeon]|nr:N-6 DNA methylase [Sulfolobales archaeon]
MSFKPHENVRVKVVNLITQSLKTVLESRCRVLQTQDCYVLRKLLEEPEGITILMPQEVYVGREKWAVDTLLGDVAVIEYKGREQEFEEAERSARGKYWDIVSKRNYYIVTTWEKWRIYRVTKNSLELVVEGDRDKAKEVLETQILPGLKALKIPPLPENIEALYKLDYEKYLEDLKQAFRKVKDDPRIKPLYEAYRSMIQSLYSGADEGFYEDLFIRHTYMHIAVIASLSIALGKEGRPEDIASGSQIGVDVALPYLNWWKTALLREDAKPLVEGVVKDIVGRARLVDWSLDTAEDVFRTLYEFLVEPPVRRKLGEYYTPVWLVEMMLSEFDLPGKVVLDPFCGSGTFLIKAFHEKVKRGEDPEKALSEVVGFDINPLAIAVARAELLIAYKRASGKEPENPPHVYHVDTFATWFSGYTAPAVEPELEELAKKAHSYLNVVINFRQVDLGSTSNVLAVLRLIEKNLTFANRFSYKDCNLNEKCLEEKIEHYMSENLKNAGNSFLQHFLEHFKKNKVAGTIAKLIVRHGGNDVWAVVFTSIYAPILLHVFKPDIIVTNPPWIQVTEYKAPYSEGIRSYMLKSIRKCVGDKATQVLNGADIASAALAKSIELASSGVGFIMNRDQLFNHRSSASSGIVASYCMLEQIRKNTDVALKLYDFDFDVFQHGIPPAVVILKRVGM